ncbi:hypothetical protein [Mycolicibacterium fluoranthenivorans]|uniref:Uncharacterized protein n=1 Tax=Mycolicibacterium fluoranthenivorans TaxID=258505 RepID=A0A1G4WZR6_9MYCO|nr:hypothetical protein [Mycolicibacterium fluoranthenivorans]SCX32929.1 hypothetical protein SAMN02799620_05748 [Mycolicibacterium fluoranthenivorans]
MRNRLVRFADCVQRQWLSGATLVSILVLVFWLAYGFAARWGADQWGPYAEWFAGAATVAAVVVALRESARGSRAREVDYELVRRRECLKALGDVWAALMEVSMDFVSFRDYLDDLPAQFDASKIRGFPIPELTTRPTLGEEITDRIHVFFTRWMRIVEPSLFVARSLLEGTPMQSEIEAISADIHKLNNLVLPEIRDVAVQERGRRPDTTMLSETWATLYARRSEQLRLATKHFGLNRHDIEKAIRQRSGSSGRAAR